MSSTLMSGRRSQIRSWWNLCVWIAQTCWKWVSNESQEALWVFIHSHNFYSIMLLGQRGNPPEMKATLHSVKKHGCRSWTLKRGRTSYLAPTPISQSIFVFVYQCRWIGCRRTTESWYIKPLLKILYRTTGGNFAAWMNGNRFLDVTG